MATSLFSRIIPQRGRRRDHGVETAPQHGIRWSAALAGHGSVTHINVEARGIVLHEAGVPRRALGKGEAMNLEKFTERSRGFLQAAQTIAMRESHPRVLPEHLLKALMD